MLRYTCKWISKLSINAPQEPRESFGRAQRASEYNYKYPNIIIEFFLKSVARVNWLFRFRFCRLEGLKMSSRYSVGVLWDVETFGMHHTYGTLRYTNINAAGSLKNRDI